MLKFWLSWLLLAAGSAGAWVVHGPAEPTPAERTAVRELEHYLAIAAGPAQEAWPDAEFFVGTVPAGMKIPGLEQLEEEEWKLIPAGKRLVIYGGGDRGTLYGVYRYIEDKLGVRWWNRQEEYVPKTADQPVLVEEETGKPFFAAREVFRFDLPWDGGRFQARQRMNRDGNFTLPAEYGGGLEFGRPGFAHTFEQYIPWAEYGESHPEFFSLVNGKRAGGPGGQICLTNPEVLQLMIRKLDAFITESEQQAEAAGLPPPRFYELSQNDNIVSCQCPDCVGSDSRWGVSGTLIRFLNEIGAAIEERHPDVAITTLAYLQTEIPPTGDVKARSNVWIRLCDTVSSQAQSHRAPGNGQFVERLEAWRRVAPNLLIWDYSITYPQVEALLPFPSEFLIAETVRILAEAGCKGIFFEHEIPFAADMYDLKVYMEAKLMEDPYRDAGALYADFLRLHYGPGAEAVGFYRDSLRQGALAAAPRIPFGSASINAYASMLPLPALLEVQKRFDAAEQALREEPVFRRRLHRARLGLDFLTFKGSSIYRTQWREAGNDPEAYPIDNAQVKRRLLDTCAELEADYPESTEHYAFRKNFEEALESIARNAEVVLKNTGAPAGFENRPHTAYSALDFARYDGDGAQWEVVYDDDAETGVAAKISDIVTSTYYSLPLEAGIYSALTKRSVGSLVLPEAELLQPGYHWYHFTVELDTSCYLYFTRSWSLQLHFAGIEPGRYRIWCRVAYQRDRDRNTIALERVVLEKLQD